MLERLRCALRYRDSGFDVPSLRDEGMDEFHVPISDVLLSRLDAATYVLGLKRERVDRRKIQKIARGLGVHSNANIGGILRLIYEELKEG